MELFCGWRNDPRETARIMQMLPMPLFADAGRHLAEADQDVLLYLFARKAIGTDAPKGPQGIGDCVSWGWGNLVNYVQSVEIVKGAPEKFVETATESIYGLSRVEVGGERGSYQDGSVGAWAAKAVSTYGCLGRDVVGPYDPKRAKAWGAQGLSADLEGKAKLHLIKTVSLVKTFSEAAKAISNGYPVAVCSNYGFNNSRGSVGTRDKDGFCTPRGTWNHCMLFVGVRFGGRPGLCCSQSWGPNVPDGPLALDQPDNTFWIDADVTDKMLGQGDSFTGSQFDGYIDQDVVSWKF